MTRGPEVCSVRQSANEAARIMWERDCGSVPVVDDSGGVVGMVTDRDICMAAYFRGAPLSAIALSDIMARQVYTCRAEADLAVAERLMRERQVRRLPVVAGDGSLVGMLSSGDVSQGVTRKSGQRPSDGEGLELIQTVAAVSEPRLRSMSAG
jgi:CBS domain-containing protein